MHAISVPIAVELVTGGVHTAMQVHLFDIDIPGKITFKESETLTQGESFTVVDTPACRMGIGICYDLRFPELAMVYAQRGVQLIVYPGAQPCTAACIHCIWACARVAMACQHESFTSYLPWLMWQAQGSPAQS